jgi:hypothetical protein
MSELTAYIILRRLNNRGHDAAAAWEVIDPAVHASSADQAIRKAAKDDGVYVATPGRSFRPVNVQSVQQTILKLNASPDPT